MEWSYNGEWEESYSCSEQKLLLHCRLEPVTERFRVWRDIFEQRRAAYWFPFVAPYLCRLHSAFHSAFTTLVHCIAGPLGAGGARGSEPGAGAGGASTARSSSTSQSRETEGGATERSEKSERTARASQNSKRSSERSQSRHSQSQHSQHGGTRSQSRNHRASPSASSTAGASSSKGGADTAVGDAEEAEPEGVVDSTRPPIAAAPGAAPVEVSLQATVQVHLHYS